MQFMEKLPDPNLYGKKVSATIYCTMMQVNGKHFLKYHYIDNTTGGIRSFIRFAKGFPGASHINFYSKKDNSFIEQFKF